MSYDYDQLVTSINAHRNAVFSIAPEAAEPKSDGDEQKETPQKRQQQQQELEQSRLDNLQKSVESFTALSSLCPMTPLLWIQYAHDYGSLIEGLVAQSSSPSSSPSEEQERDKEEARKRGHETELNVLELGINEFPGCALLRLYYLETLCSCASNRKKKQKQIDSDIPRGTDDADARGKEQEQEEEEEEELITEEQIHLAFRDALERVGSGSHRNEGEIIASIHRLYVDYLASALTSGTKDETEKHEKCRDIIHLFAQRARTPTKDANDALSDELRKFATEHSLPLTNNDIQSIEEGKMFVSKTFSAYATMEDDIDVIMNEEGILWRNNETYYNQKENYTRSSNDVPSIMNWDAWVKQTNGRYLMGLGGVRTANAFVAYAKALSNHGKKEKRRKRRRHEEKEDENHDEEETRQFVSSLAIHVYERAVSECPTVESLWIAYIRHLKYVIADSATTAVGGMPTARTDDNKYLPLLKNACSRSVRNCPYSIRLYEMKMSSMNVLADTGFAVFDPEEIMNGVVKEAIESKFLPNEESCLEVHMMAIRTVKRRILSLVSNSTTVNQRYDEVDSIDNKKKKGANKAEKERASLNAETKQEVHDLIEDIREMYDATDSYLRKRHGSWTEARAALWMDRASTEAYALGPIFQAVDEDGGGGYNNSSDNKDEALRCFDKAVNVQQPSHPDVFREYIKYTMGGSSFWKERDGTSLVDILGSLRKVRGLYQRAMSSVKKQQSSPQSSAQIANQSALLRDYDLALYNLCQEYLDFERKFGSEESYSNAVRVVSGKLRGVSSPAVVQSAQQQYVPTDSEVEHMEVDEIPLEPSKSSDTKRKLDHFENSTADEETGESPRKKSRTNEEESALSETVDGGEQPATEKKTNLKVPKEHPVHKVRIGNLEYPAHPYTVRVSNLSPETEDMDLVDTFRPKCGPIVHARILRDKHHAPNEKGKSRCVGLIQFEERDSVEKALELNDVLGLHEKLIKVERSNIPAATLVPPGMHRVNPQGQGRSTKKNQKKKEVKAKDDVIPSQNVQQGSGKRKRADSKDKGTGTDAKDEDKIAATTSDRVKDESGSKTGQSSVLAFRPRGLHGYAHRKVKVAFDDKKEKR